VLPSIRHHLWALLVLAPVAACDAILGLGDPIDGGGPAPGTPDATVEGSGGGDAAQTHDGPAADGGSSAPDSADATQNPMDATQTDTAPPPDSTTSPDTGTVPDATDESPDGDPCEGLPDGACTCRTNQDCADAGDCCCLDPTFYTACTTRHDCPIYNNGSCL
jgi:hypothetical protein